MRGNPRARPCRRTDPARLWRRQYLWPHRRRRMPHSEGHEDRLRGGDICRAHAARIGFRRQRGWHRTRRSIGPGRIRPSRQRGMRDAGGASRHRQHPSGVRGIEPVLHRHALGGAPTDTTRVRAPAGLSRWLYERAIPEAKIVCGRAALQGAGQQHCGERDGLAWSADRVCAQHPRDHQWRWLK